MALNMLCGNMEEYLHNTDESQQLRRTFEEIAQALHCESVPEAIE